MWVFGDGTSISEPISEMSVERCVAILTGLFNVHIWNRTEGPSGCLRSTAREHGLLTPDDRIEHVTPAGVSSNAV
jgi:hypothetical protein